MNWIDVVIIIFAVWYAYKGLKNGLIYELFSIVALVLGVWATVCYSGMLVAHIGDGQTQRIIAFACIFIATLILVHFAGRMVEKVVKLMIPSFLNNLAGLIFGVAKVVIVFSVLFIFIEKVDTKKVILKPEFKTESFTYKYVESVAPFLTDWYSGIRGQESGDSVQEDSEQGETEQTACASKTFIDDICRRVCGEIEQTSCASKRHHFNNPIRQYGVDEQTPPSSSLEEATLSIETV